MIDEKEVLDEVRRRNLPETDLCISRTIPGFLSGELIVVDVSRGEEKIGESFYYAARYRGDRRSFTSMDELALWMGQQESLTRRHGRWSSCLSDFRIVSAIIAILITLTIVTVVLVSISRGSSTSDIPDILANALTTILGFYFGSQVAKTRSAEAKPAPD
jgi:hypothetical protein